EFPRYRIMPIALGLGTERADHLRMAVVTTFAQINIASFELRRRVRFDPGNRFGGRALEEQGDNLDQAAETDGEHHQDRHQANVAFDDVMTEFHGWISL